MTCHPQTLTSAIITNGIRGNSLSSRLKKFPQIGKTRIRGYPTVSLDHGVPQNTAQTPPTDCQRFADIVDSIADAVFVNNNNASTNSFPHNVNYFMDRLAQRFTGMRSATIWQNQNRGQA